MSYPNMMSPTAQLTLNPALVRIDDEVQIEPVQRFLEAPDGTQFIFQLSPNRRQSYEVIITNLPEADFVIAAQTFSGYNSLKNFMDATVNWMERPFDMTHSDGLTTPVRLRLETWSFREGRQGFWSGTFTLRKVV